MRVRAEIDNVELINSPSCRNPVLRTTSPQISKLDLAGHRGGGSHDEAR